MSKIYCNTNQTTLGTECFMEFDVIELQEHIDGHKPGDIVKIQLPIKAINRAMEIHNRIVY